MRHSGESCPVAVQGRQMARAGPRGPHSRLGGAAILLLAAAAALAAALPSSGWLALGGAAPVTLHQGAVATQRRLRHVALRAEGEESATDAPAATEDAAADAPALNAPLFDELNVSTNSSVGKVMGAMVAIFNKGERAVDLVLIDPRQKHKLIYSVGRIPDKLQASAKILQRRRDRRLRVRVRQHYRPEEDEDPELMFVGAKTNISRLGQTVKDRLVDPVGNNRKRTVKLRFSGNTAATNAILAIEDAMRKANRELVFRASFEEALPKNTTDTSSEGSEAAEAAPAEGSQEGGQAAKPKDTVLTVTAS